MRSLHFVVAGALGVTLAGLADAKDKTPPPSSGVPGVVWKDATGRTVDGITGTITNAVYYFDTSGYVWSLTTNDAQLNPVLGETFDIYYATPDCSDPGYLPSYVATPRFTFKLAGEATYRTFSDTAQPIPFTAMGGVAGTSGCNTFEPFENSGISIADTISGIPLPVPGYVAPLHPEYVR